MDINSLVKDRTRVALLLALLAVFFCVFVVSFYLSGPGWDVITHYMNAKNYLNPRFLSKSFVNNRDWQIQYDTFYIEPYREAVPSLIFIPLILLGLPPILGYLIVLYILFAAAIWFFCKSLKFDSLMAYGLMLSPFFVYMSLMINGTEILSLSLLLIMIGFIYRKSRIAGIFMGLAGLAKYPTLVFLPLLLFLGDKRKIAVSYALFALVTLPWLVFNYIF